MNTNLKRRRMLPYHKQATAQLINLLCSEATAPEIRQMVAKAFTQLAEVAGVGVTSPTLIQAAYRAIWDKIHESNERDALTDCRTTEEPYRSHGNLLDLLRRIDAMDPDLISASKPRLSHETSQVLVFRIPINLTRDRN